MPTIKFLPHPCPFCGYKPKIRQVNTAPAGVGSAMAVTIACESKKCAINPSLQVYNTSLSDEKRKLLRKEAIKKWNQRKNYSLFPTKISSIDLTIGVFNELYTVGTELIVIDDFGVEHKRKLESPAWAVGTNSAIARFEGLSGGYNIFRVKGFPPEWLSKLKRHEK